MAKTFVSDILSFQFTLNLIFIYVFFDIFL